LPLKLVGSHVGVTLAADGPSQMGLADIGFMRALAHADDHRGNPGVTILTPSDAVSAYNLVLAMAEHPSACYLRAVRADLPILYNEGERFPFGGHKVVRQAESGRPAIVLVGTGYMVHSCLAAAEALRQRGVAATVIDAYALPLDATPLLALARSAGAPILTVEDSYVGGIGSELSEAAAAAGDAPRLRMLAVRNIPKSGRKTEEVLAYVHLSVAEIVQAAENLTRQRAPARS
jgi:transketolase